MNVTHMPPATQRVPGLSARADVNINLATILPARATRLRWAARRLLAEGLTGDDLDAGGGWSHCRSMRTAAERVCAAHPHLRLALRPGHGPRGGSIWVLRTADQLRRDREILTGITGKDVADSTV